MFVVPTDMSNTDHTKWMKLAIVEAEKARLKDEVPVGAVVVSATGSLLAASHNQTILLNDPSGHAEILVLRSAANKISNYRLLGATLYVTIEPCIMCMGAIIHARIGVVVYGAKDPKWGAAGSLYNLAEDKRLNHQPEIIQGICEDECREILQSFFQAKRKSVASNPIMP